MSQQERGEKVHVTHLHLRLLLYANDYEDSTLVGFKYQKIAGCSLSKGFPLFSKIWEWKYYIKSWKLSSKN